MTPLPDDELLEAFKAALQADENDEAVYGWMVEKSKAETGGVLVQESGKATRVRLKRERR